MSSVTANRESLCRMHLLRPIKYPQTLISIVSSLHWEMHASLNCSLQHRLLSSKRHSSADCMLQHRAVFTPDSPSPTSWLLPSVPSIDSPISSSITLHSFIPGLKPSFSANPSDRSLLRLLLDWLTQRIPRTVYRYLWAYPFLLFSFSPLFSCWFRVVD